MMRSPLMRAALLTSVVLVIGSVSVFAMVPKIILAEDMTATW